MKYTFINGEKQQTVEIPDEVIKKHKRTLGCTTSEAINLFLFDEGYIENDEVTKLTNKAKANGAGKEGEFQHLRYQQHKDQRQEADN